MQRRRYGDPTRRNYHRGTGKGSELAQGYRSRCAEITKEPGCEQFEVFQNVMNPDKLAILERWTDQGALDAHAK